MIARSLGVPETYVLPANQETAHELVAQIIPPQCLFIWALSAIEATGTVLPSVAPAHPTANATLFEVLSLTSVPQGYGCAATSKPVTRLHTSGTCELSASEKLAQSKGISTGVVKTILALGIGTSSDIWHALFQAQITTEGDLFKFGTVQHLLDRLNVNPLHPAINLPFEIAALRFLFERGRSLEELKAKYPGSTILNTTEEASLWYDEWGLDAISDDDPPIVLTLKGERIDVLDLILGKTSFPLRVPPALTHDSYPCFQALCCSDRNFIREFPDTDIAKIHAFLSHLTLVARGRHSFQVRRLIIVYCRTQRNRVASPSLGRRFSPQNEAVANVNNLEKEEAASRADECAASIALFCWLGNQTLQSTPYLLFVTLSKVFGQLQHAQLLGQGHASNGLATFFTPNRKQKPPSSSPYNCKPSPF